MSTFAINGRIVFHPDEGLTASAHAIPSDFGDDALERRAGVSANMDPRLCVLELVAALALELRGRGDEVIAFDVE